MKKVKSRLVRRFFARRAVKAKQKRERLPEMDAKVEKYFEVAKRLIRDTDSKLDYSPNRNTMYIIKDDIVMKFKPSSGKLSFINGKYKYDKILDREQETYLVNYFHKVHERRLTQIENRISSKVINGLDGVIKEIES